MKTPASIALAAGVVALGFTGAAHAQLSWQGTAVLSAADAPAERADVEMSSGGEAINVWKRLSNPVRIDATLRPAGGNFSVPGAAVDGGAATSDTTVDATMGAAGHAQAVWEGNVSGSQHTLGVFRTPPSAGFGPRATISAGTSFPNFTPESAIDAQGNAVAVWEIRYSGGPRPQIRAGFRNVNTAAWSSADISVDTGGSPHHPRLAMRGPGDAVAVWSRTRLTSGTGFFPIDDVETAYRSAGATGTWTSPLTICAHSASPTSGCIAPQVAMGGDGSTVVVWERDNASSTIGSIHAVVRSPGPSGTWGAVATLTPSGAQNPHVAMDAQGNGVVVWERGGRIEAAYRPAGGSFRAAVALSAAGTSSSRPRVAMSSQGRAVVAWAQVNGGNDDIKAVESGGDGNFGAVVDLASQTEAYRPDVAMDAAGNAVVTWEGHDGAILRIHSRIGVVPGAPPPPPPPPPPPEPPPPPPEPGIPSVTAIRLAEPIQRDHALVLTAEVAGPVERIVWYLPGGRTIEGNTLNGRLQRSVRFRADPGSFSVRAQAFGAGRTGTSLSRSFTMPRPRTLTAVAAGVSASDANRVRNALERLTPVSATGDALTLAGRSSSCATPTSIRSGRLDMTGCFTPTETLADIPTSERGVLDPLARELGLPVTDASLMRKAVELSDGYITRDPVALEGGWPLVPRGPASILAFPQANAMTSSNAGLKVGGYQFGPPGGFVLNIDPRQQGIALPALPRPPSLKSLGGFPLVGDFDVKLVGNEAHISSTLKLPSFLKKAGVDVQAGVKLRATPDRLIVDDMTIGPMNVDVGALSVNQFRIGYRREGGDDLWQGQGKACVISGICLDMAPPNGQVKIRNGRLDFAGASLGFRPGIPIFSGVDLERIGFGFGLNPTRFTGNARLTFSQILVIDGRVVLAFPSPQEPFFLRRDEVGNDFPDRLYTYRYTGPTFGISAAAALRLPAVGEVPLAKAYVLYEYPGYLALGGGMSYGFTDPLTGVTVIAISGRVDGEFNASNGRFNVDGHVQGCVVEIICKGFDGNVSSRGMAVCTNVTALVHTFHAGGAVRWSPFKFIPYLDGCSWGRFREPNVRGLRKAQAGGAYRVQMAAGAPSRLVQIEGRDGAPRVRVTGPGGQALDSPEAPGLVVSRDGRIRVLRSPEGKFVSVALARARPGTYSIETMDGSVPIGRIQESTALPAARVTGRLRGAGARRVLEYAIARRPDQVVTFQDVGPDGAGRDIGTVRGGGRGRLAFSPVPGRVRRTIKARFEIDGMPAEERVVASFAPPSPVLGRPARVRVRRLGTRLGIAWARVPGAARYEVAVTLANGRQRFAATRRPSAVLRGISRGLGGRVTVRAVAPLRQGRPALARFRPAARRRTAMRPLPRCRGRARIVCTRR